MFINDTTLVEAKDRGRRSAEVFMSLRRNIEWCRRQFMPRYREMDTEKLVDQLYETQLKFAWCRYGSIYKDIVPCRGTKESTRKTLLGMFKKEHKSEDEQFKAALQNFLYHAQNEGVSRARKQPCLYATPFHEEIELMQEELLERFILKK